MFLNRLHTFSARLWVLFMAIAIIPILMVVTIAIILYNHVVFETANTMLADLRDEKIRQLCTWQNRTAEDVAFLASIMHMHPAGESPDCTCHYQDILAYYSQRHPEVKHLSFLCGQSGRVLFSTMPLPLASNLVSTTAFTRAQHTNSVVFYQEPSAAESADVHIDFAYPVRATNAMEQSAPTAVLIVRSSAERLRTSLISSRVRLGKTGEVLLVKKNSNPLSPLNSTRSPQKFTDRFIHALIPYLGFHADARTGLIQTTDSHGHAVLAATAPVPNLDLMLIVKQDLAEIYTIMERCLVLTALAIPIILAILIPLARNLARRVTGPFGVIKSVAEQLHAGNLSARTNITRNDEIGDVAHALDTAAETIELETNKRAATIQQVEEELYRAQRMDSIGNLAGGIAHDFNNMLQAILGFAELLEIDTDNMPELHDHVVEIQRAATRAKGLTHQLLAFAQKQVSMPVIIRVNDFILSSEKMFKRLLHVDTTLQMHLDPAVTSIYIDPNQLQQVLLNLISNANDARRPKMPQTIIIMTAMVDIQTPKNAQAQPGPYLMLSIHDQGVGISAEHREKIFEPFFTTKAPGKGLGLGLSVVDSIVRSQKGWITVDSDVETGTTFAVYLPIAVDLSLQTQRVRTFHNLHDFKGNGRTVLLVEDEEVLRTITTHHLVEAGYHVLAADGVQQADSFWKEHQASIDIIVCDVVLDDGNGIAFSTSIRATAPRLPILLVSGYSQDILDKDRMTSNQLRFLAKPYSNKALLNEVAFLLSVNT